MSHNFNGCDYCMYKWFPAQNNFIKKDANLGFGSCQTLVWQLPNSGLAVELYVKSYFLNIIQLLFMARCTL